MANGNAKIEMEHRELLAFVGTLAMALVFVILSKVYPHYALVMGTVIVATVLLVLMFKTLESKNVFGKNMTYVWMALVFGFMLIFTTLLNQGLLPYWFYTSASPMAVTVSNALVYALITITALVAIYVAYIYKTGKNPIKRIVSGDISLKETEYFKKF